MSQPRNTPGVIAPPPLIFLGFLAAGYGFEALLVDWSLGLDDGVRRWLAVGLILVGLVLEGAAAGLFRKLRTAIEPWKPSTALATTGVYRFSRNPIYLGFAITYAGLAIGLDSPVALGLLPPCLVVIDRFVIAREERYLEAVFGEAYRAYRGSVRRWL